MFINKNTNDREEQLCIQSRPGVFLLRGKKSCSPLKRNDPEQEAKAEGYPVDIVPLSIHFTGMRIAHEAVTLFILFLLDNCY